MGLMDKLDFTQKQLWRTIEVVDMAEMDEPHVLQQKVKYPTSSAQTETTAPLDEHRLVPLSELLESEPSFWEKVSDEIDDASESESSEGVPEIGRDDRESDS